MTGYLERLCEHSGFIRLGEQCSQHGDPWEWGVTVSFTAPLEAMVMGLFGTVEEKHWRGVEAVLGVEGFHVMWFHRRDRKGRLRPHRHRIRVIRKQNSRKGTAMEKRLHILGGGFTVVGVDGKFRNSFPGPNHFRVTETEYVNIVQPEYISFLKSLLELNDLPKPASDEGRVHLIQGDTYVVDDEGNLHTHIGGSKYLNLADSVFLGIEQKLIASQERLNAAAKAGLAASQAPATAAA